MVSRPCLCMSMAIMTLRPSSHLLRLTLSNASSFRKRQRTMESVGLSSSTFISSSSCQRTSRTRQTVNTGWWLPPKSLSPWLCVVALLGITRTTTIAVTARRVWTAITAQAVDPMVQDPMVTWATTHSQVWIGAHAQVPIIMDLVERIDHAR